MHFNSVRQSATSAVMRRISLYSLLAILGSASLSAATALAAIQERLSPPATAESAEEAARAISGSPWPGIIDHQLQRPLPDEAPGKISIYLSYPSLGIPAIDQDIRGWTEEIANAFVNYLDPGLEVPDTPDVVIDRFLHDNDLNSDYAAMLIPREEVYELLGSYYVTRPSDSAVSITYEIWNYTPDNRSNLDILTLNYNLLNGQRLTFMDIFERPRIALELMSSLARERLMEQLGNRLREQMLKTGTEPLIENFSSLTLTPTGICINFQPWQVAPWDAGIQKVEVSLEDLAAAGPLLSIWGREQAS